MNTIVQSEAALPLLTQADIARAAGVSQPAVSVWLRRAGISPDNHLHSIAALAIGELARLGMSGWQAASLVGGCRNEIEWLLHEPSRECWLVVVEHDSQVISCRAAYHREQVAKIIGVASIARLITLHAIVSRAEQQLRRLQEEVTNA